MPMIAAEIRQDCGTFNEQFSFAGCTTVLYRPYLVVVGTELLGSIVYVTCTLKYKWKEREDEEVCVCGGYFQTIVVSRRTVE